MSLFDGAGAALVGGVASALIALLVVRLTIRGDRRLAHERDARDAAVRVIGLGKTISTISTEIGARRFGSSRSLARERDARLRDFQVATFVFHAAIQEVDLKLAINLQQFLKRQESINPDYVLRVVQFASQVLAPQSVVLPAYDAPEQEET